MLGAALLATPAMADNVELTKGKMSREGSYVVQYVTVKNNATVPVKVIMVECGFLQDNELVGTGLAAFRNVLPG